KYAFAVLPIVVKSTPGISMSMPPILIGAPVAFLPVPRPQTDFVADALPAPTGPAAPAPIARAARANTRRLPAADATPLLIFVDLIRPLLESRARDVDQRPSARCASPRQGSGSRHAHPPRVGCVGDGGSASPRAGAGLWASAVTSRILDHCLDEWNRAP